MFHLERVRKALAVFSIWVPPSKFFLRFVTILCKNSNFLDQTCPPLGAGSPGPNIHQDRRDLSGVGATIERVKRVKPATNSP